MELQLEQFTVSFETFIKQLTAQHFLPALIRVVEILQHGNLKYNFDGNILF